MVDEAGSGFVAVRSPATASVLSCLARLSARSAPRRGPSALQPGSRSARAVRNAAAPRDRAQASSRGARTPTSRGRKKSETRYPLSSQSLDWAGNSSPIASDHTNAGSLHSICGASHHALPCAPRCPIGSVRRGDSIARRATTPTVVAPCTDLASTSHCD